MSQPVTGGPKICSPPQRGIEVPATRRMREAPIASAADLMADHMDSEDDSMSRICVRMVEADAMPKRAAK